MLLEIAVNSREPCVDALTCRLGSVHAAILDLFNAAMSGLARSRFCLAMSCATARFCPRLVCGSSW